MIVGVGVGVVVGVLVGVFVGVKVGVARLLDRRNAERAFRLEQIDRGLNEIAGRKGYDFGRVRRERSLAVDDDVKGLRLYRIDLKSQRPRVGQRGM